LKIVVDMVAKYRYNVPKHRRRNQYSHGVQLSVDTGDPVIIHRCHEFAC